MKTKINLIVTVKDNGENDLTQQLKTIEKFCRIKNQHGCEYNGRKLTFEINLNQVFVIEN